MRNQLAAVSVLALLQAASPASAAEPPPAVKVARADLERLPGSYVNEEMGMALEVELEGDGLRVSILEGPSFPPARLIPTSPTRFRWEGDGMAPGLALAFQVAEGRATALSVIQPNKPAEVVLKRSEKGLRGRLVAMLAALLVLVVLLSFYRTAATRNGRRRQRRRAAGGGAGASGSGGFGAAGGRGRPG